MRQVQALLFELLSVLFVLLVAGCGTSSFQAELPEWALERELTIGSLDDSEQALTFVGGLTVDDVGNIYVTQPRDQCIRVFSPDGDFIREIGRGGEGPGEFASVGALGWIGDTLYVSDSRNQRVSYFGRDGSFLRSTLVRWPIIDDVFNPRGVSRVLPDGTVLVKPSFNAQAISDGTISARPLFRMDTTGAVLLKVAETSVRNEQLFIQSGQSRLYSNQPFSDSPLMGLSQSGDYVVVLHRETAEQGTEGRMRLEKITSDGDTSFVVEIPYDPVPLLPEAVDSVLEGLSERFTQFQVFETAREARRALDDVVFVPAFYAPANRVVVTSGGEIWVQRESIGGSVQRWDVLSPEGSSIAKVMLPASTSVFDAKDGLMWATERDELDVTYVVRYRLL